MSLIPALEDPLEKKMTTQSSIPAWEIPWTEAPAGLQSVGTQRVRHNRAHVQTTTKMKLDFLLK